MPHQLVLNYLSSRTNFVFNQALYTPFRERYAVMTPSIFFWRPFWKSYSLTKAKLYLVNQSNPAKTEENSRAHALRRNEINPVQIPHPSNATFKFPSPRARCTAKCPGYARGGMLKFRIDQRIRPWKKSQHVLIKSVILWQSFLSAMKRIISTRAVGRCPCGYFQNSMTNIKIMRKAITSWSKNYYRKERVQSAQVREC